MDFSEICKVDKGAAMTLILQEAGVGQAGRCLREELLLVSTLNNRVLFQQKLGQSNTKKIELPLVNKSWKCNYSLCKSRVF